MGLIVATVAAVLLAPGVAHADPYPVEPPASTVSDGTVSDGGTVTFSGKGFLPFEEISIEINYSGDNSSAAWSGSKRGGIFLAALPVARQTLHVTADAKGEFSIQVKLAQVGTATLLATGLTSGVTVTTNVKVMDSKDTDTGGSGGGDDNDNAGSGLPRTGPSGAPLLVAGGAVLLGVVLLLLTRVRRRRTDI